MKELRLSIGEIAIETEAERAAAERLPAVLREAFRILAERLARTGLAGERSVADLVLGRLQVDVLSADELLGPRGAERLADELHRQIRGGAS